MFSAQRLLPDDQCLMTADWCPVTGDWCLVLDTLTGAQYLVITTYTMNASHIRGVATKMGPTPGGTALWGGDPIFKRVVIR